MYRLDARTRGCKRGYEPYLRLVGLGLLLLLAVVLVFGVVVADLLVVAAVPVGLVAGAVGVIGAAIAAFPGVILSTFASR
jgi:hypothetical protein